MLSTAHLLHCYCSHCHCFATANAGRPLWRPFGDGEGSSSNSRFAKRRTLCVTSQRAATHWVKVQPCSAAAMLAFSRHCWPKGASTALYAVRPTKFGALARRLGRGWHLIHTLPQRTRPANGLHCRASHLCCRVRQRVTMLVPRPC